jgi:hypothetical protein
MGSRAGEPERRCNRARARGDGRNPSSGRKWCSPQRPECALLGAPDRHLGPDAHGGSSIPLRGEHQRRANHGPPGSRPDRQYLIVRCGSSTPAMCRTTSSRRAWTCSRLSAAEELRSHGVAVVSLWPRLTRTEAALAHPELFSNLSKAWSPLFKPELIDRDLFDGEGGERSGHAGPACIRTC